MNIAIVDDEKIIREQIKSLIEKQKPDCCLDSYGTGEELLKEGKSFDVLFLDIQMDGMNGIDTAKVLRERGEDTVLVFITAVKEYVFEAFDVSAFHYLLKPIEEKKFEEVFDRAVKEAGTRKAQEQDVFFIKTRNRNITLDRKTILYVENQGKKVEIHTTAEIIEIYASMKELELQLGESFCRCHRGYLVNMAYIAEYENDSIRLSNGEKIFMAKERYHEFVKEYMRYLRSGGTIYA
jgi:DNA-binding LytR/AlgR family response regulator